MSSSSSGLGPWSSGRRLAMSRALRGHAEQLIARSISASRPRPPRSCSLSVKPLAWPSDWIAGGWITKAIAPSTGGTRPSPAEDRRHRCSARLRSPTVEGGEHQRIVLALPEEAEAAHDDEVLDLVARHPELGDRLERLVGALLRGTRGRLDRGDQKALVLGGQEGGGQPHEQQKRHQPSARNTQRPATDATGCGRWRGRISAHPRKPAVEAGESARRDVAHPRERPRHPVALRLASGSARSASSCSLAIGLRKVAHSAGCQRQREAVPRRRSRSRA